MLRMHHSANSTVCLRASVPSPRNRSGHDKSSWVWPQSPAGRTPARTRATPIAWRARRYALQPSSSAFALALAAALVTVAVRQREAKRADWWRPLLGLPLCAWGQLVTLIGLQIAVGAWSACLRARRAFGATCHWRRLVEVSYYMRGLSGQDMDGAMLLATFGILALTAKDVVKRLAEHEQVFVVVASFVAIVLAVVLPAGYWGPH